MARRLGVLTYLDVPLGSVGSTLSKATLNSTASRVREQTNNLKQTNKQTVPKLTAEVTGWDTHEDGHAEYIAAVS